ncbi:MAG: hypothetical protein PHD41_07100 [Methanosarcinaceae archaeon]|nr:hypothetical protein [Methanosarcinaceae archaeon]MDD4749755.1 hypothetical protein [Methanosarcinaceae archaeon]
MDIEANYQKEKRFALVLGSLYAAAGLLQLILGTGLAGIFFYLGQPGEVLHAALLAFADMLFIPADILGGFVLLVVGATFLSGAKELGAGISEGKAYVYVGTLLALTFAVVYLLTLSGNALDAFVLGGEALKNWSFLSDLKPGIYLAVLALPAYLSRKTRFSLGKPSWE